jgi:hypothetical protein
MKSPFSCNAAPISSSKDKMDISRRVTSGERHRLSINARFLFDFNAKFLGLMFHAFTVRIGRDLLQPAAQLSGHARMTS